MTDLSPDEAEVGGLCSVCGGGLRYGERHRKCGDAAMEAVADVQEHLREMTEGRDHYMAKSRALKASQEALRTAVRAALQAMRAEGLKYGRLCELLDAALKTHNAALTGASAHAERSSDAERASR